MVPCVEIAAFIVSLLALGVSLVAAGYARRKTLVAEDSAAEARRSADAAQEAISYQREELGRERRARRVPPADLLDLIRGLHNDFTHIISNEGRDAVWFADSARADRHSRLAALAGQIVDDRLNDLLGKARFRYIECSEMAPTETTSDPTSRKQLQVARANEGRAFATKAINRYNDLVRHATGADD
jgi:hypothetical protein